MPRVPTSATTIVGVLLAGLLVGACAQEPTPTSADQDDQDRLAIAIASFDLAVGEDQRLLAGVLSSEAELLVFGEVQFMLAPIGDAPSGTGQLVLDQSATADFLPVPGMEPEDASDQPRFLEGQSGSGVYAASVDLDEPGFWALRVIAETEEGRTLTGDTTFSVQPTPQVPTVGDAAPRTLNLTVADVDAGSADPSSIDSRAGGNDPTVPDRHLHDRVIAEVIAEGRPVVVGVTTPVYCVSRFCGPLTEVLAELADEHADRATFVHLEVWKDFDNEEVNEAAAEWILTDSGGNEPWVFLVDETGTITHRWDNVLDLEELRTALREL